MVQYSISEAADDDLDRLYIYSVKNFGLEKTERYTSEMVSRFEEIAEHPKLYPAVDHIRKGYRRSVFGSHSIYYRIIDDCIIIERVLGSENPYEQL